MHKIIPYVTVFLFGSIVGSFLNVCIYRIPRNLSIIIPSSRCPSCDSPVKPWDNIPILSYIFLGGRCRACKARISFRYPFVELLNAVLYIMVLWRFGSGWHTLIYFVFCSALIVIAFIDLDFQIIPDRITLIGILIGLITGSFLLPDPFLRYSALGYKSSIIGFLVGGGFFYAVAVLSRGGMGGGDIKMMAMVGSLMGWKSVLLTTFLGSLVGAVFGTFLMLFKGKGRKTKIPFGPFLALGSVITLFYGQEILYWYLYR
ncbi:MAG: prepilin peptidase [Nitrospirota bacterium]